MQLPVELGRAFTGTNVNASTLPKYRIVGYGTPTASNRNPINSLHVTGVDKIAGVVQDDVLTGEPGSVFSEDGDVVTMESDGTATIAYGDEVVAVAGSTLANGGRVAARGSVSAGTNVRLMGTCVSSETIPATAGARLSVRLRIGSFQGA